MTLELPFQRHDGVGEADGEEECVQARVTTEECQERAEQIYQITLLPDNLFVFFPLITNSLGLEHGDSNPMVDLKIERPIEIFPTLR